MTKEEILIITGIKQDISTLLKNREEDRKVLLETRDQTLRTNGRVTALEKQDILTKVSEMNSSIETNRDDIHDLNVAKNKCPVEEIKKQTKVIRFFYEYPKIARLTLIGVVISITLGVAGSVYSVQKAAEIAKIVNKK